MSGNTTDSNNSEYLAEKRVVSERFSDESPNKRYVKVKTIFNQKMNQILGKGANKIVYKAIDREEGIEVAWNCTQVAFFNVDNESRLC
jgi:hypothetical protein